MTSLSITLAELFGIENEMVSDGNEREGESLTGRSGTKAIPTKANAMKETITVKDESLFIMAYLI